MTIIGMISGIFKLVIDKTLLISTLLSYVKMVENTNWKRIQPKIVDYYSKTLNLSHPNHFNKPKYEVKMPIVQLIIVFVRHVYKTSWQSDEFIRLFL